MDKKLPTHIAIIPDGNRRWAKKKDKPSWEGHIKGAKTTEEIIRAINDLEIKYVTIWGSSYDNLVKRTSKEVAVLDKVYRDGAEKLAKDKDVVKKGVRVRFLGEWREFLTPKTITAIEKTEDLTKNNTRRGLTILIAYNGDREVINAINKLVSQTANGKINENSIKQALWTAELPPVDLVIRTGGNEPHLSNGFMMWDTRYAELYFSPKMWPEFTKSDLNKALDYYASRERRFGK
ncbi:MAG: di-trans,poly-cis-decaprenylcistransferase [Candidatus Colwellbacteria bacterium]|nr:di-trans,poly-cis-decaprenylcistransferase [Candidatus Colwellbacteria bacterium]